MGKTIRSPTKNTDPQRDIKIIFVNLVTLVEKLMERPQRAPSSKRVIKNYLCELGVLSGKQR